MTKQAHYSCKFTDGMCDSVILVQNKLHCYQKYSIQWLTHSTLCADVRDTFALRYNLKRLWFFLSSSSIAVISLVLGLWQKAQNKIVSKSNIWTPWWPPYRPSTDNPTNGRSITVSFGRTNKVHNIAEKSPRVEYFQRMAKQRSLSVLR